MNEIEFDQFNLGIIGFSPHMVVHQELEDQKLPKKSTLYLQTKCVNKNKTGAWDWRKQVHLTRLFYVSWLGTFSKMIINYGCKSLGINTSLGGKMVLVKNISNMTQYKNSIFNFKTSNGWSIKALLFVFGSKKKHSIHVYQYPPFWRWKRTHY